MKFTNTQKKIIYLIAISFSFAALVSCSNSPKNTNTTDSKLKNSFVAAGLPTTADDPQYPSKASHAVILVKVK